MSSSGKKKKSSTWLNGWNGRLWNTLLCPPCPEQHLSYLCVVRPQTRCDLGHCPQTPTSPSGWQEPAQGGLFLWNISFLDLPGNWTCLISSVWCALKAFSAFKCCLWYHVSENRAHHPFEPDSLRSPGALRLQPSLFTAHCGLQVKETDVFWGTHSPCNKTQTTKHSVPEIAALIRRQSNLTLKGNMVVFLVSLALKSFFGPCWSLNACSQRCALC